MGYVFKNEMYVFLFFGNKTVFKMGYVFKNELCLGGN